MVHFIKSGGISLSGGEQIVLIIKSWQRGGWRAYFKERKKEAERYHWEPELLRDWIDGGKRLQEFERKHRVRFIVKELNGSSEVVGFRKVPRSK